GQTTVSFDEVEEFVAQFDSVEDSVREDALMHSINEFLFGQKKLYRIVFVQKYWYFLTVRQIAERNGISESKVLSILHRLRLRLKDKLGKEGYTV
ncbi:MAG: sigma-70 family RNA polymerase sigma factor, partial [Lachnospiraceae bacterium]|nr:sigma-70 family RNA polymerase sigma factor [Lachnospiraceae bacterium]